MNNELIEAAKAVIARWDSTDWKAAPTAEVMNRLRAALSAKPEPIFQAGSHGGTRARAPKGMQKEAKLPEVESLLAEFDLKHTHPGDLFTGRHNIYCSASALESLVNAITARITAAHAAELAMKDAETAALKAGMVGDYDLDAWLDWRLDKFGSKIAEAEAKGRREALQGVPVDALIYAALILRLETGNIESFVNSKTVSAYEREISRLIESARAAQSEVKNGA